MSSFLHPQLLWALPLLAVPVLIHLINLAQQRRVAWAAMEFLLASQRKNSAWIRLKELILLLLRMLAVAAIILALAEPLWNPELGFDLGGRKTRHLVLLDDSYSMSDRWSDTSALARAKQSISRVAEEAALRTSAQTFSLLRFSAAAASDGKPRFDLLDEPIDANFSSRLAAVIEPVETSQLAVGPGPALAAAEEWAGPPRTENLLVYLLTDFRKRQWDKPADLVRALERLNARGFRVQLVQCVDAQHPNLAVTELEPVPGPRAVNVPIQMQVSVRNFGPQRSSAVSLALEEDSVGRTGLLIDELDPGASVTRTFSVQFAAVGQHAVAAHLASDAVDTDNHRYRVVGTRLTVPVLIIDGDPELREGRFLATALAPEGSARTGIEPRLDTPALLDHAPLEAFQTIFLTGVPSLSPPALQALEHYVRSGGGLAVFMGERCQTEWYDKQFYHDGAGLFPLPLAGATPLVVDRLDKSPDLIVSDHPIFRVFLGERNSFLSGVTFERFFAAPRGWQPPAGSAVRVLARLRNGSPLAVEKPFGAGRVVAMLSTAAPLWNNWGRNPSFVVTMLELEAWLDRPAVADKERPVGKPIELDLDAAKYEPRMQWVRVGGEAPVSQPIDARLGAQGLAVRLTETQQAGIHELQLTTRDRKTDIRRFAFDVDPDEGDLALVDGHQLAVRLTSVKYEYRQAGEFAIQSPELAGSRTSDWIVAALVLLLIGEQTLAFFASYHPAERTGGRR